MSKKSQYEKMEEVDVDLCETSGERSTFKKKKNTSRKMSIASLLVRNRFDIGV